MTIVPKSGWPVFGQTAVNSGQVISISYSRSGNWFGKVSGVGIGRLLVRRRGGRMRGLGGPRSPIRPDRPILSDAVGNLLPRIAGGPVPTGPVATDEVVAPPLQAPR